jgi:hypothetical protein
METGFGSPQWQPMPPYNDWGFGSSTTGNNIALLGVVGFRGKDTGFGSPFDSSATTVFIDASQQIIPDSGNISLRLVSTAWAVNSAFKPPRRLGGFDVKFTGVETGDVYQGIGLIGKECYTDFTQKVLTVRVPPLPIGTYSISVEWDEVNHVYIDNAFRTIVDTRCESLYALRSYLPSWFAKGEVSFEQDEIGAWEKESNMSSLLSVLGHLVQGFSGRPTTASTSNYEWGDTTLEVESTLGFPSSGSLFFDEHKFEYSGKTDTSFTGVSTSGFISSDYIPKRRKVSLDVKSYI